MIGHLPIPVYALMIVCAWFGLLKKRPGGAPQSQERPPVVATNIAWAIVAIFVARFAVSAWFDPGHDGDIPWQLWLGQQILKTGHIPLALGPEAFTAAGAPWTPQEWALSVLVALTVNTPRFPLLVLLTTLSAALTIAATLWASRRLGASTLATALAVFCVAFSMLQSYGIRAQVFAWCALAIVMLALRARSDRAQWWIVPAVAVWANVHASAMLAPALVGIWTAGVALDERAWNARVRHYVLLTAACAAAVFMTPLGYHLPLYAISLMQSPIRTAINEWQPTYLSATSFGFGALPLIVATCLLGVDRKRRWSEIFTFAAVTFLAFSALRNVPVAAIVLGPAVAQRLTEYLPQRLRINVLFSERPIAALLYAGTCVAMVLTVVFLASSREVAKADLPVEAIAALQALPGTHNLYCEDFAWCSIALAYPNIREFIDGRCDPFPLPVWKDYEAVYAAKGKWREILDRRNVDAIVVDKRHALARALPAWHSWHIAYRDGTYRLFVRNESVFQTL